MRPEARERVRGVPQVRRALVHPTHTDKPRAPTPGVGSGLARLYAEEYQVRDTLTRTLTLTRLYAE